MNNRSGIRSPACTTAVFLEEFLLRELARADRKKHPLSIITMDIDHFKRINDTLAMALAT